MKKVFNIRILAVISIWILQIVLCYMFANAELFHDAKDYWSRGIAIFANGDFSLLNISGFRGYVYPLYIGICNKLFWGEKTGFIIINSLIISLLITLVLPRLHKYKLDSYKGYISCVVLFILFNFFFYGLSVFPLTDLFAITLCSISILLENKLEELLVKNNERGSFIINFIMCFLLGATIYFAYNVRTIYMFAGIWLLMKVFIYILKLSEKVIVKFGLIICGGAGVLTAAIPQIYMNYMQMGKYTLSVPTNGLMLSQVSWGIRYQRYDTLITTTELHPSPKMYYIDNAGNALMEQLGISEFTSWGQYIEFVLHHPFDVAGVYIRHLVNMLFPCYPEQYVTNLNNNKIMCLVLSITCIFLFSIAVANRFVDKEVFVNYIALLIPVCFILPGAVESRFFAALFIMILGTLCFNVNWKKMKLYIIQNKVKILILYIILGGMLTAMWGNMLASESAGSIFFS